MLLSACVVGPDGADDDLARNRERWRAQRIQDYQVQFRLVCFCGTEVTEPVTLEVRRGTLVSVTRVADGRAVDSSQWRGRYYTVDELFALIAEARQGGAHEVRVAYDGTLGHPVDVYLDPNRGVADDERHFQVSGLVPLR